MSSGTSWWIFNARRNRFCLLLAASLLPKTPLGVSCCCLGSGKLVTTRSPVRRPIKLSPAVRDPTGRWSPGGAGKVAQALARDSATVVSSWPAAGLVTLNVEPIAKNFSGRGEVLGVARWGLWPPPPTSRLVPRPSVTRRRGAWWTWWTRPWAARATRCRGSKWWAPSPSSPSPSSPLAASKFSCTTAAGCNLVWEICWTAQKQLSNLCKIHPSTGKWSEAPELRKNMSRSNLGPNIDLPY